MWRTPPIPRRSQRISERAKPRVNKVVAMENEVVNSVGGRGVVVNENAAPQENEIVNSAVASSVVANAKENAAAQEREMMMRTINELQEQVRQLTASSRNDSARTSESSGAITSTMPSSYPYNAQSNLSNGVITSAIASAYPYNARS